MAYGSSRRITTWIQQILPIPVKMISISMNVTLHWIPARLMLFGSDKSGKTLGFRVIVSLLFDCMGQDEKNVSKGRESD